MSRAEALFEMLNISLEEGTLLTETITRAVQSPDFTLNDASAYLNTICKYLTSVECAIGLLEYASSEIDADETNALADIADVAYHHGMAVQELLVKEITDRDGDPEQKLIEVQNRRSLAV